MATHTVTHHPVRSDSTAQPPAAAAAPTRWALAGLGAGITGAITIVSALMIDPVYDKSLNGDTTAVAEKLGDLWPTILVFHVAGMISTVLLIVFAAGLYRRLRATAPDGSVAPLVAFSGLIGTAFVMLLGTGLDTEFLDSAKPEAISPDNAAFYNHWVGTIPWCWGLLGLAGIALYTVARTGGVPRWLGRVGLVGGGITLLFGISPLQYMAGMTGPIGLIVVALGFLVGDKVFRGR